MTTNNAFTEVGSYPGENLNLNMLCLPDGKILLSNNTATLRVYTPVGNPLPAGKSTISRIAVNADGSYHLTGTKLNGLSQGSSYGDDSQMDSNYPIVRLTDSAGNVHYARTYNWSSTGVQTGSTPVSTEFTLPSTIAEGGGGTYSIVVVANGISSDPVNFVGPVWVDFDHFIPGFEFGTKTFPYQTLAQGVAGVSPTGAILIKGPGTSPASLVTPRITKAVTILSLGGASTVLH